MCVNFRNIGNIDVILRTTFVRLPFEAPSLMIFENKSKKKVLEKSVCRNKKRKLKQTQVHPGKLCTLVIKSQYIKYNTDSRKVNALVIRHPN